MDAEEITREIDMCMRQDGLNKSERSQRLIIFNTALRKANRDQLYNKFKEKYKVEGQQLEELTNHKFVLDTNIITTEIRLRNYLVNSELNIYLNEQNIKSCTFDELLNHANTLAKTNPQFKPATIQLAIQFYQTIEKLGKIERDEVTTIAIGLSEILGQNLISEYDNSIVVDGKNPGKIKSTERTIPQLLKNKMDSLLKIEQLRDILGDQACEYACQMIDQVFEYYINGNKEIELSEQLTKQV